MSAKTHGQSEHHGHRHESEHHHHGPYWKRAHRDWKLWFAVVLMLACMAYYVMSFDESLQPPGGQPQQPVPAAAGP